MQTLIDAIKEWPVIVQGALGSALFWVLLVIGQWLTDKAQSSSTSFFQKTRKSALVNERVRLTTLKVQGRDKTIMAGVLVYRMTRPFLMAIIWMLLGHIFSNLIGAFSIIGYIGALYYSFNALSIVKAIKFDGDVDERIKEIDAELSTMKHV